MAGIRMIASFLIFFAVIFGVGQAEGGNITLEMPTGMFINPTAEVPPAGTLTPQACWLNQDLKSGTLNGYVAFVSYTFATKTEIGPSFKYVDPPAGDSLTAPGGFVRQLLLDERGMVPALAVGATFLEDSDDKLTRRSAFASISKTITPEGAAMPVHIHVGGKWVKVPGDDDASVYGGVDIDVTNSLKLVAETAGKTFGDTEVPFAIGIQYSFQEKLGISLAAINAGGAENVGIYFGIGYPFTGS